MKFVDSELDLHRLTVDEALPLMNDYLYNAFASGFSRVCINHGKGTGTLKQAIQRELKGNSLVKSFRPGDRTEGSVGVTIVELSER